MTAPFTLPERRKPVRQWPLIALAGLSFIQFLAIGGLVLVLLNFQSDSMTRSATARTDRAALAAQLASLTDDVARLTADNRAKDQQITAGQAQTAGQAETIRMLTDLLQSRGIAIPTELQQRVDAGTTAAPSRAPSSSPSARPSAPTTPPSSAPSTTPQPSPTPTPSPTDSSLVGGVTSLLCLLVPFAC